MVAGQKWANVYSKYGSTIALSKYGMNISIGRILEGKYNYTGLMKKTFRLHGYTHTPTQTQTRV